MSKDFKGLRMKLDIKPIQTSAEPVANKLLFSFNFNKDTLADSALEDIRQALALWDTAKEESKRIVASTLNPEAA